MPGCVAGGPRRLGWCIDAPPAAAPEASNISVGLLG
jgi:hypothetical protein